YNADSGRVARAFADRESPHAGRSVQTNANPKGSEPRPFRRWNSQEKARPSILFPDFTPALRAWMKSQACYFRPPQRNWTRPLGDRLAANFGPDLGTNHCFRRL